MGRRKIDIVRIENERHRQVTFTKRKSGLIKKATELAILCDAQVGIVIFGANQKMSLYASTSMDDIVSRYRDHADTPEVRPLLGSPLRLTATATAPSVRCLGDCRTSFPTALAVVVHGSRGIRLWRELRSARALRAGLHHGGLLS